MSNVLLHYPDTRHMTAQEILSKLKKKQYDPVYVLHGEEPYFIDLISDYVAEHVLSESEKAFNQITIYGKADLDEKAVIDNARQFPMMAQQRVVILKEAQQMRNLKRLDGYIKHPTPSTILVICHKHKKIDGRGAFLKAAKANAVVFESKKLYDNQVIPWIENHLHNQGRRIDPKASHILLEYLGNDLGKIANELSKLLLNIPAQEEISEEHVYENIGISKDYNVFELQKYLGTKDHYRVSRIIRHFIANPKSNPLILVISNLYSFYSKLYVARAMEGSTDQQLAQALGLRSAYFIKDYKVAARNYSLAELETIFGILRDFDLRSKGVNSRGLDPGELMREMAEALLSARHYAMTGI